MSLPVSLPVSLPMPGEDEAFAEGVRVAGDAVTRGFLTAGHLVRLGRRALLLQARERGEGPSQQPGGPGTRDSKK